MIILDATVLIGLHSTRDAHHKWCLNFFNSTLEHEWAISALTLAEAAVFQARNGTLARFESNLASLELTVLPFESGDSLALARVRSETNLKMPDALVFYAAQKLQATLATSDKHLARLARDSGILVASPE